MAATSSDAYRHERNSIAQFKERGNSTSLLARCDPFVPTVHVRGITKQDELDVLSDCGATD
jgi:hypothetical protein